MTNIMLTAHLNKVIAHLDSYGKPTNLAEQLLDIASNHENFVMDEDGRILNMEKSRPLSRTVTKWAQFLQREGYTVNYMEELQALATAWGEVLPDEGYEFKVSEDVVGTYQNGPKSCMTGGDILERVKFYERNGVSVVQILHNGTLMGRALLWPVEETNSGERRLALDRIYPDNAGRHVQQLRDWAAEQGWLMRSDQGAPEPDMHFIDGNRIVHDVRFEVKNTDGHAPYFDTFRFAEADGGKLYFYPCDMEDYTPWSSHFSEYSKPWQHTDIMGVTGPVWEAENTLEGMAFPSTLAQMICVDGEYGFECNFLHCAVSGKKKHFTKMVQVTLESGLKVYVDVALTTPNAYLAPGEDFVDSHHLTSDLVTLTAGMYKGRYVRKSDVHEVEGLGTVSSRDKALLEAFCCYSDSKWIVTMRYIHGRLVLDSMDAYDPQRTIESYSGRYMFVYDPATMTPVDALKRALALHEMHY